MANSSVLVLPSITTPAASRRSTAVAMIGRDEILQDARAAGAAHARHAEHVLDRQRHPQQGRQGVAGDCAPRQAPVGLVCLGQGQLGVG